MLLLPVDLRGEKVVFALSALRCAMPRTARYKNASAAMQTSIAAMTYPVRGSVISVRHTRSHPNSSRYWLSGNSIYSAHSLPCSRFL